MPASSRSSFIRIRRDAGGAFDVAGSPKLGWGDPMPDSERPNGVWAQWEWNGRELVVHHDPAGFQPIYYFTRPGEIAVAPSVTTLLRQGAPRDLDEDALAVFFRLGFFVGDDTPFRAIRAVPANVDLRWTSEGADFLPTAPPTGTVSTMDRREAIAEYQRLFSRAIRRRLATGPIALPLSGGRDSRHILFELVSRGRRPELTLTIGRKTDDEGSSAAAVAKALGVRHELLNMPPPSIENEQRKNIQTNFCSDEHTWCYPLRESLEVQNYTLYDGIGGDVLSAGLFLEPKSLALFREARFEALAHHLIQWGQQPSFATRFLDEKTARRFGEDRCLARLAVELKKHATAANPCGSFFFANRTRREIALSPFAIFGDFEVHAPYLDVDLVNFLMSLPAEMLLDHTFHDDTIAQAYPQWAHLPYAREKPRQFRPGNLWRAQRLFHWARARPSTSLNYSYLLPRILRAGIDPSYNRDSFTNLMIYPIYWSQLEKLARA